MTKGTIRFQNVYVCPQQACQKAILLTNYGSTSLAGRVRPRLLQLLHTSRHPALPGLKAHCFGIF